MVITEKEPYLVAEDEVNFVSVTALVGAKHDDVFVLVVESGGLKIATCLEQLEVRATTVVLLVEPHFV